jgi:hypothetical protein
VRLFSYGGGEKSKQILAHHYPTPNLCLIDVDSECSRLLAMPHNLLKPANNKVPAADPM